MAQPEAGEGIPSLRQLSVIRRNRLPRWQITLMAIRDVENIGMREMDEPAPPALSRQILVMC